MDKPTVLPELTQIAFSAIHPLPTSTDTTHTNTIAVSYTTDKKLIREKNGRWEVEHSEE
jgi:hypothetical protein